MHIVGIGVDTSLFFPIRREEREKNIDRLIKMEKKEGRTKQISEKLFGTIDRGDIAALTDFKNLYPNKFPDADVNEKLKAVPWDATILLFVGAMTVGKGLQTIIAAMPGILAEIQQTYLLIAGNGAYRDVLEGFVYAIESGNKAAVMEICEHGFDLDFNSLKGPWQDVKAYLSDEKNLQTLLQHGKTLREHVVFLGRLDHCYLCHLFPCADFSVFPSIVPEAYGLVLMESFSNGVVPMVSYYAGFRDGIDDVREEVGGEINELMKILYEPQ